MKPATAQDYQERIVRTLLYIQEHLDDELLPVAQAMARKALAAPVELIKKITATVREMPDIDDHRQAMLKELDPQAWSIEQPHFQETLAALRQKISEPLLGSPVFRVRASDDRHQPAAPARRTDVQGRPADRR